MQLLYHKFYIYYITLCVTWCKFELRYNALFSLNFFPHTHHKLLLRWLSQRSDYWVQHSFCKYHIFSDLENMWNIHSFHYLTCMSVNNHSFIWFKFWYSEIMSEFWHSPCTKQPTSSCAVIVEQKIIANAIIIGKNLEYIFEIISFQSSLDCV